MRKRPRPPFAPCRNASENALKRRRARVRLTAKSETLRRLREESFFLSRGVVKLKE